MQKLSNYHKAMIENYLYKNVLLSIEIYSDKEGNINKLKPTSRRIIVSDEEAMIRDIVSKVKKFSSKYNLEMGEVKDYLLHIIKHNKKGLKPEQPTEAERILKIPEEDNIK